MSVGASSSRTESPAIPKTRVHLARPSQHIAQNRPARLVGDRTFSEDPVIAESLDGPVGLLEPNPVVEELSQFGVVSPDGEAQRLADF